MARFRISFAAVAAAAAAMLLGCGSGVETPSPVDTLPAYDAARPEKGAGADAASPTGPDATSDDATPSDAGPSPEAASPDAAPAPWCVRDPDAGAPGIFLLDGGPPAVAAPPQAANYGGPILHAPTFIPVTFPGDTLAPQLEEFLGTLGCSQYWSTIGADYGVGEAVAGTPVRLTEDAPATIDDTGIRAWLTDKIEGGDPRFPPPDGQTIYVLFYPATSTETVQGATSCVQFAGYHEGDFLSDGTPYQYAVIPRCPAQRGSTVLDDLTTAASHELIEASTDPQPDTMPAYQYPDDNHPGYWFGFGAEVADLCELESDPTVLTKDFPWTVSRVWSNRSAALGLPPCLPVFSTLDWYAAPIVTDVFTTTLFDDVSRNLAAVHIPIGTSATIDVQLVSGSAGVLNVQALDLASIARQTPQLHFTFDRTSGMPGDTLHLTIQKVSGDPQTGAVPFVLLASPSTNFVEFTARWGLTFD